MDRLVIFAFVIIIYRLFLFLYRLAIRIAALFNPKAALWINGRKSLLPRIRSAMPHNEQRIWMHCASLGEFEQGRPVLEAFRAQYPEYKIVLTFFSPSGYEVRKNYEGADYIFYLPMDSPGHARQFIAAINPSLVLFVKYEFWYYYLTCLKARNIPTILIAAAFRQEQAFFKWYGGFFRKILRSFTHILVQDAGSRDLLARIGIKDQVEVGGDTRYDRVIAIAEQVQRVPAIDHFQEGHRVLIAGSTWPADEEVLKNVLAVLPADWKMIIAPHEIGSAHLQQVQDVFGDAAILFSEWKTDPQPDKKVLIIDNMGMLSGLYQYGSVAFIGGGFNKGGIHNVLEPAVFGIPVLFGPVYEKFVEADALVKAGYGFPVQDAAALSACLNMLLADPDRLSVIKAGLVPFIARHKGAADKVLKIIDAVLIK